MSLKYDFLLQNYVDAINWASQNGHVQILEWFKNNYNYNFHYKSLKYSKEVNEWLLTNGIKINPNTFF